MTVKKREKITIKQIANKTYKEEISKQKWDSQKPQEEDPEVQADLSFSALPMEEEPKLVWVSLSFSSRHDA